MRRAPPFDPLSEAFAADPYAAYRELREAGPVFRSDALGMSLLTRYADIFRALTDRRLGRAELPGSTSPARNMPAYDRYVRVNLLETEGETHARLRRLLSAALTPKRVAALKERVARLARELVDRIEPDREFDFMKQIAEPLPVTMISELLGWPTDERHRLRPWSADIVRLYEKSSDAGDLRRAEQASREFSTRVGELATARKAAPTDDFISALAALEDEPGGLSRDELISSCILLLNAGHEATVNAAGNGLLALLQHPEAMATLKKEPSVIETAVEEMLRYDPPLHLFHRFACEDLEIGGERIAKGEKVGLLYGSANRDPAMFADPDRFDIGRQPNRHLAFGAATHFCLGAPLARLELRTLFATLIELTSEIKLRTNAPRYRRGLVFRGLEELRISWST